jgi:hypothetical protein
MVIFYAEETRYLNKKKDFGITWDKLPAFTIVTFSQRLYYPLDARVNLGDARQAERYMQDHMENFFMGRLEVSDQK